MPGKGSSTGHGGQGRRNNAERNVRGRSESSPGHLKREAGEQSARDFAPGRSGKPGRGTVLPEGAPEDMGED
ncbi:MAG: hypothetical protein HYX55_00825 [Chloroflexi bacterium]|nr:hypothetical protein [Chloroflexota bacterium]